MSDSFRQVGQNLQGGAETIVVGMCRRKLNITAAQAKAVYTLEGNRDALLSGSPDIGSTFETILTVPFRVSEVDIDDGDAQSAKMTITTEGVVDAMYADPLGAAIYTVKFQELRKAIETHPCCGSIWPNTRDSGGLPASFDRWEYLIQTDDSSNNWKPAASIPTFFGSISPWTLAKYQSKKLAGEDEFLAYYPTLTRVLTYLSPPDDMGAYCGTQQSPPTGSYPFLSLFQWLAGPDELAQRGSRFERTTSWTGVDFVDPDFYPNWAG